VPILSQNVSERGLFGCHPERKFAEVKDQREAIFMFIATLRHRQIDNGAKRDPSLRGDPSLTLRMTKGSLVA
jgi:hypothetical protein